MTAATSIAPRSAVFFSTVRNWGWGAPDYVWPRAASQLLAAGVAVIVVVRDGIREHPQIRQLAANGAQLFRQPPLIYRRGRLSELKRLWLQLARPTRALGDALARAPAPHFFVEQAASYDFLEEGYLVSAIETRRASYDVFFHSNNYGPPFAAESRRRALDFILGAHRTLFNSRWTRELTELQLLHRLPNAGYFSLLVRFLHDEPLPWPADDTLRLASVSRLDCHHKGLDVLLQGLAMLPSDSPSWTLDIYGSGPDEDYLRDLSAWLGLESRVSFHSATDDIPAIWRRCHLLALVSRYEGLGVSMLEALACGRPVFRTPYGGCDEWIAHGETGYVCPAAEPSIIARSLQDALRDHARWPAIGRAGQARIRAQLPPHPESVFLEPFGLAVRG